ncbi:hypothetical protein HIM_08234 [Hirsutella minnesotensis 3608]|uniref:Uncharacterized protein n=1 Tax=Hirsutella minnesotensis 3608 TaxID=1043627 RepID=A0A0F7ZHD1_9HYPO|nr:hypothetical protein HIM_08234 [Hirsutella minnesotensis 3608]
MSSGAAVRFVTGTKKSSSVAGGVIRLQLRVKPGASKDREGVVSVLDDCVELCVAAQPRDGEANKAVVKLLSDAAGVPKSRLSLTHGARSRDKTVVMTGVSEQEGPLLASTILDRLQRASAS